MIQVNRSTGNSLLTRFQFRFDDFNEVVDVSLNTRSAQYGIRQVSRPGCQHAGKCLAVDSGDISRPYNDFAIHELQAECPVAPMGSSNDSKPCLR